MSLYFWRDFIQQMTIIMSCKWVIDSKDDISEVSFGKLVFID